MSQQSNLPQPIKPCYAGSDVTIFILRLHDNISLISCRVDNWTSSTHIHILFLTLWRTMCNRSNKNESSRPKNSTSAFAEDREKFTRSPHRSIRLRNPSRLAVEADLRRSKSHYSARTSTSHISKRSAPGITDADLLEKITEEAFRAVKDELTAPQDLSHHPLNPSSPGILRIRSPAR